MYTVEVNNEIKTYMHMVKSAGISIHSGIIHASSEYNYKVHVNQRHAHIRNLPDPYDQYPIYTVLREPSSWYKSFYRFFVGVEGYLSWALNDPKEDGYIYPIEPDEFARRMINMKDTLTRFPNKARVFRNLLRSQGNMHFITGYFQGDFYPNDLESMQQFDCSLYEWFLRPMGQDTICIPMDRLDIIEEEFKIKIPHVNKTPDNKIDFTFSDDILNLIRETHSNFYEYLDNFDENNPNQLKEIL